jgi:hypothetical protein
MMPEVFENLFSIGTTPRSKNGDTVGWRVGIGQFKSKCYVINQIIDKSRDFNPSPTPYTSAILKIPNSIITLQKLLSHP